jgi:transcriptional regulator with XRE-family HTH domain
MLKRSQSARDLSSPFPRNSVIAHFARDGHTLRVTYPSTKKAANHLRAWREFRGLSQAKLAEMVGTEGNVIGLLESGERGLSDKWLRRLAPALGTTPGILLDHDPGDLDDDILALWAEVPRDRRHEIRDIIKVMIRPKLSA